MRPHRTFVPLPVATAELPRLEVRKNLALIHANVSFLGPLSWCPVLVENNCEYFTLLQYFPDILGHCHCRTTKSPIMLRIQISSISNAEDDY